MTLFAEIVGLTLIGADAALTLPSYTPGVKNF